MKRILIILSTRRLYLYRKNNLIRSFSVAIGKPSHSTPTGNFKVINKIKRPYNQALGTRWIQFTYQMHGIHGTNQPQLIGKAVSHGCVRMYNRAVEYLYSQIKVGTPVKIRNNNPSNSQNQNKYFIYTIKPSDTLFNLAVKFNTTIEKLVQINNLKNKALIYPGQQIKIPVK